MAKGNMFQGMARGKVGDIVFSRLDGQQISRVRNRNPKNPRSNAQLYQRAIMATVMQAYSAGKEIFDHSFQGKSVGAANQRHFLSINAKKLRETIANEIAAGTAVESQIGRVVAPGVKAPVPYSFQVSDGSLTNMLSYGSTFPNVTENETVAAYCARLGLVAGDIFTFVGFMPNVSANPLFTVNGQSSAYAKQFPCVFVACRLEVKSSALTSTDEMANFGQIFSVTKNINCDNVVITSAVPGDDVSCALFVNDPEQNGAYTIIHSRKDEDLRSPEVLTLTTHDYGLATQYALAAWQQGTVLVGDSNLILEGGDNGNVL